MNCNCTVEVDGDYDENFSVSSCEVKQAGKDGATCNECGTHIPAGTLITRELLSANGNLRNHITCPICMDLRKKLFTCFYYGNLIDDIRDFIMDNGDVSESCFLSLTYTARLRLAELLDEYFEATDEED